MALFCQSQSCLHYAIQGCPFVPRKVRSIVVCNLKIIHALSTLVNFVNWVKYPRMSFEKADRGLPRPCASLFYAKFLLGKKCILFHGRFIRHVETVISLGEIELAEDRFTCQICAASDNALTA